MVADRALRSPPTHGLRTTASITYTTMDLAREQTAAARAWRAIWRRLGPIAIVFAVTLGVAMLVPLGLYLIGGAEVMSQRPPTATPLDPVAPLPAASDIFFKSVQIVDVAAGAIRPPQDVLVRNGRIESIGSSIEATAGAQTIESAGRYLMPGLIDTHVHVTGDDQLFLFVAAGVTTVQGLGGPLQRNLDARERAMRGEITSPDYISCDYVVYGGKVGSTAAAIVDAAAASGAECIKIYSPPDWTTEEYAAVIREATTRKLRIGGHLPRNLPIEDGLGHGQQFVAHAEEFLYAYFNKLPRSRDPSHIPHAVDLTKRSGAAITPTLIAYGTIVRQVGPGIAALLKRPELRYIPPAVRETWLPENNRYRRRFTSEDGVRLGEAYEYQKLLVAAWNAAGVPIVLGTDASPQMPFVVPGFSALDELGELRAAGLTNAAVLRAATITGARLLGREREIGQVAPGLRADLISARRESARRRRTRAAASGRGTARALAVREVAAAAVALTKVALRRPPYAVRALRCSRRLFAIVRLRSVRGLRSAVRDRICSQTLTTLVAPGPF